MINRINRFCVAVTVTLMFGLTASAAESPVKQYAYNNGTGNVWVASISAALSGSASSANAQNGPYTWSVGGTTATGGYILGYCKTTDSKIDCTAGQQKGYANYDPIPTRQWCASANVAPSSGGLCPDVTPPPPTCKNGELRVQKFVMSSGGGFPTHDMVCNLSVTQLLVCRLEVISGVSKPICMFETKYDGTQYTQNAPESPKSPGMPLSTPDVPTEPKTSLPPTTTSDANSLCPKGAVQGGVDSSGIPICIGSGTQATPTAPTTTTTPVTTTSNSDGSSTASQSTTVTNADGSKTTTTTSTTTAQDGTKTVTQQSSTTANTNGSAGTADPAKDGLCAQNPDLTICKNSSVAGACEAVTCTGDAIQCATLRAAATMQCREKQDRDDASKSPLTTLGNAAATGADPMKDSLPSADKATVINGPSSLDDSGWLGGGSYFVDKTFTVQGHQVTLPFSKTASVMVAFRYAMMLVAALVSFKILRGAILT